MQELRFVAVSEDGSYAVLAVPGRSGRFILPIDERLRAVALGQTSRLAQYEIEVESPLRPKEIQARIRAGETAEEIADAAGIPVERVRWFEGPVLAERAYIADQAQAGSVRRAGDSSGPGPRLGDIVTARLSAAGTDPADGQWDSRKRGDGNWQVSLTFPSGGRLHVAEWVFDPRRRHVMPDDDNAARLSLPESELPPEPVAMPGEATVTPIASRLGTAAGMGGGGVGAPGVSRFRPERSVIPDRSLGVDRSLADRPLPHSAPDHGAMPDRAAMSDRPSAPVLPRPAQPDRPSYQGRPASAGYAEFPESAPYRAQEPESEPPAYRDPPRDPAAYRPSAAPAPAYQDPAPGPGGYDDRDSVPGAYRAHTTEPPAYPEAAPGPRAYRDPVSEPDVYRAPAAEPPAAGDPELPPAANRGPAPDVPAAEAAPASALQDSDRARFAPPRPVVFEDDGAAFLDEQLELAPASAAEAAAASAAAPQEPATAPPATAPASFMPPHAAPAAGAAVSAEPVTHDAVAARTEPAPVAQPAATAEPEATAPAGPPQQREPEPTAAQAGPHLTAAAEPVAAAAGSAIPASAQPAAPAAAAAAAEPKAEVHPPVEPAPADDQQGRSRPTKKNAKGRRSSVPSWDEIMLGSSRQRD